LIVRCRFLLSLGLVVSLFPLGQSLAEESFPAPLPNGAQSAATLPFSGAGFEHPKSPAGQSAWPESCTAEFIPLREEAERRSRLIKAASDRHAPPDEACRLFASFSAAEIQMIKYVEAHAASCGIPAEIAEKLKASHKGTEGVQKNVCALAEQRQQQHAPAGPTGDFDGKDELKGSPKGPS
jgi:hypothetical protein